MSKCNFIGGGVGWASDAVLKAPCLWYIPNRLAVSVLISDISD